MIRAIFTRGLWNGSVWNRSRVGKDRLPVYMMSWDRFVLNRPFNVSTYEQFQATASLSILQEQEICLKKFSLDTLVLRSLIQNFLRYQISSFLSVHTQNGSARLHGNFRCGELLDKSLSENVFI